MRMTTMMDHPLLLVSIPQVRSKLLLSILAALFFAMSMVGDVMDVNASMDNDDTMGARRSLLQENIAATECDEKCQKWAKILAALMIAFLMTLVLIAGMCCL